MSNPLVVVCGPTGSGKSSLAIRLARHFDGEIINADSLQVFRQFDIGTAKLSPEDRLGIPHHLIDAVEPGESFTAGDFLKVGREILQEVTGRGHLPVVAGGTGFYIRALLDGLSAAPSSDEGLRTRLGQREQRRPGSLHRILARSDSRSAQRIHSHDLPKLIRALEIRILSRHNASEQPPRAPLEGYRTLCLALAPPREELYGALDQRCEEMLSRGLLNEIRDLLASGVPRNAKPFQSLGYKQGLAVIDGSMSPENALLEMQRDTRRYAKRQMTWFRHEPGAWPLSGFGDDPRIQEEAIARTDQLLNSD